MAIKRTTVPSFRQATLGARTRRGNTAGRIRQRSTFRLNVRFPGNFQRTMALNNRTVGRFHRQRNTSHYQRAIPHRVTRRRIRITNQNGHNRRRVTIRRHMEQLRMAGIQHIRTAKVHSFIRRHFHRTLLIRRMFIIFNSLITLFRGNHLRTTRTVRHLSLNNRGRLIMQLHRGVITTNLRTSNRNFTFNRQDRRSSQRRNFPNRHLSLLHHLRAIRRQRRHIRRRRLQTLLARDFSHFNTVNNHRRLVTLTPSSTQRRRTVNNTIFDSRSHRQFRKKLRNTRTASGVYSGLRVTEVFQASTLTCSGLVFTSSPPT